MDCSIFQIFSSSAFQMRVRAHLLRFFWKQTKSTSCGDGGYTALDAWLDPCLIIVESAQSERQNIIRAQREIKEQRDRQDANV